MSLLSFIALALGMAAASADRAPRPGVTLIAVARASRASVRAEQRPAIRASFPAVRSARSRWSHRPLRRVAPPLRGAAAARAPGAVA
jgi:hypothetical protein